MIILKYLFSRSYRKNINEKLTLETIARFHTADQEIEAIFTSGENMMQETFFQAQKIAV